MEKRMDGERGRWRWGSLDRRWLEMRVVRDGGDGDGDGWGRG